MANEFFPFRDTVFNHLVPLFNSHIVNENHAREAPHEVKGVVTLDFFFFLTIVNVF